MHGTTIKINMYQSCKITKVCDSTEICSSINSARA